MLMLITNIRRRVMHFARLMNTSPNIMSSVHRMTLSRFDNLAAHY
jgi:hypothetical protein